jgi:hypothetical protein
MKAVHPSIYLDFQIAASEAQLCITKLHTRNEELMRRPEPDKSALCEIESNCMHIIGYVQDIQTWAAVSLKKSLQEEIQNAVNK